MSPHLNIHKEAKRFELEIADDLGGKRIFLSGAGMVKADVRKGAQFSSSGRAETLAFRVEAKTTQRPYYAFRSVDWVDLIRAADAAGEHPVFAVRYLRDDSSRAILRRGLAEELGFEVRVVDFTVEKSITLHHDDEPSQLRVRRGARPPGQAYRYDELFVAPYPDFITRLKTHALFA